jgi:hypothetical protein
MSRERNVREGGIRMTATARSLTATIHDLIDDVTSTVERVHLAIADLPLDVIDGVVLAEAAMDGVRAGQRHTIGSIYALVRRINREVQQLIAPAA